MNFAIADMTVATFLAPRYIIIHTFIHQDGVAGNILCRLLTGGNCIDGSNKTTTLGPRGTGIKMLRLAFTISLLIYPKMGWVKRFIRMKSLEIFQPLFL